MVTKFAQHYSARQTPQSQPIPGASQVKNSAGGFAWAVDDWTRLDRFLVLGTEGGTYYASEQKLTVENAEAVRRLIQSDGLRVVARIAEISDEGRAPKNDAAIFALAMCMSFGDTDTRKAAASAFNTVVRIGTHLFLFLEYSKALRGRGRVFRAAVASWYLSKDPETLAYQTVKYRQRNGWTHRDALRLAHPKLDAVQQSALAHALGKEPLQSPPDVVHAYYELQNATSAHDVVDIVRDREALTWEMIPTAHLASADVWRTLLTRMPMTALIRNLGRMTANGCLKPLNEAVDVACRKIADEGAIRKARVHPIAILGALTTYSSGHGARGQLSWDAIPQVCGALDSAFYTAFRNVEPTGKRIMLALDVSGSMTMGAIAGMPGLTPSVASAALSLVTAATEPNYFVMGFAGEFRSLPISKGMRLQDAARAVHDRSFGRTDCALPMLYAIEKGIEADAFVIYTDNETWAGNIHPSQALQAYRRKTGINAKLVVVGMTSGGFSIADPNDAGMLDVVGFDTATPALISDFIRE